MRSTDWKQREVSEVRKVFGDLPLVEAKQAMIVYVSRAEMENSTRGDPRNCMFSNACKRAFGSQAVLFYPTIAYVDMLNDEGERIVMRFHVTAKTREAIERFDLKKGQRAEATFKLDPVPKSRTLKAMAKSQRQRTRKMRGGTWKPNPNRQKGGRQAAAVREEKALMGLRVGTGQV